MFHTKIANSPSGNRLIGFVAQITEIWTGKDVITIVDLPVGKTNSDADVFCISDRLRTVLHLATEERHVRKNLVVVNLKHR